MTEPGRLIEGVVALPDGGVADGWVVLDGELVTAAGHGPAPQDVARPVRHVLGDRVIAPGFVDLHVHGGAGGQVAGSDPGQVADEVRRMARLHATHGTTCLLATTVSDTAARLRATAAGVRRAMDDPDPDAAVIAGVHLEGPWLAPTRRGAHDLTALRAPDPVELAELVEASGDTIRLMTLAPELPGAAALIAAALRCGIVVSVGHTEATYAQARAAFDAGATHLTHLGNAMASVDRRQPGPIGAALTDERVTVEVIADGHHVHPALLALAAQAAPVRLVAITDAIAATGLGDGEHRLGALAVTVRGGRAGLADRSQTLAGSVLTMDRATVNLVAAGVRPAVALRAATETPARVLASTLGGPSRGVLSPGARADLVVLDPGGDAVATIVAGRVVHDPGGLLRG